MCLWVYTSVHTHAPFNGCGRPLLGREGPQQLSRPPLLPRAELRTQVAGSEGAKPWLAVQRRPWPGSTDRLVGTPVHTREGLRTRSRRWVRAGPKRHPRTLRQTTQGSHLSYVKHPKK